MKEKYSTLHELANTSAIHKVKIKVIEKSRPFQSPGKKKYQRLLLQDEKGDVMRATLFEDDIQAYDSLIQQNHEYLISNPTIKAIDERYQTRAGEYQMTFSNRTVIQAIGSPSQASGPVYHSIATIPRTSGPYDRFDIIGVVLLIGDKRMVRGAFEQQNSVSEIIITDHSSHQPLTISAWNDMADFFKTKPAENEIVGFTSLRITSHKGFGLSTTMSTLIIPAPNGEKADSLRQWASSHGSLLRERKTQILNTRMPLNQRQPTTIAFIKSKTAANTIQEERHWIKASIENCSYNDIRKFVGCDQCNKKTDNERNEVFECPWCHKKDSIAKPRLALSFDAHDSTGSIQLTAFNDTIAELFGKTIDELYSPVTDEHIVSYQDIAQSLRVKPIEIQLGPTVALSKCGVLKWVLKSIALAPDTSPNPQQFPCKPSDTRSSQESVIGQLTDATSSCAPESSSASLKLETDTHSAQEIVPAPLTIAPSDDPQPSSVSKNVKTVKRSLDFSDATTSSDVLDFNA